MSNYKDNHLFDKISDTYNLSVVLNEFCEQHQDIEEICNILPLVKIIHRNIDICNAKFINDMQD